MALSILAVCKASRDCFKGTERRLPLLPNEGGSQNMLVHADGAGLWGAAAKRTSSDFCR